MFEDLFDVLKTKQAYVCLSQIILYRLGRPVLFKGNYRLKGCDIGHPLCQIQHFLSQSPPCQTFVKLLNPIIFQDTRNKSVYLSK